MEEAVVTYFKITLKHLPEMDQGEYGKTVRTEI